MAVVALEDSVFNALRGHHTGNTKLPTPRLIKIYVASVKNGKHYLQSILIQLDFLINDLLKRFYGRTTNVTGGGGARIANVVR
jgi:hypothetical protein